jgi:protein gp37
MADTTPIEWCDATWSPWEGCTKVGPGCDHCYAEGMNRWLRKGANWGPGAPRRAYSDEHWKKPVRWNDSAKATGRRLRVFPSVCDPFDNEVDPAWRARFFALIDQTPNLTWLLLTKRIGNVAAMIEAPGMQKCGLPENVWLGATVVNQEEALRDILKLVNTPARVHFISYEPALGPLDLDVEYLTAKLGRYPFKGLQSEHRTKLIDMLDWVIAGGESGPGARPAHPDWFRSLRDQCAVAREHGDAHAVALVATKDCEVAGHVPAHHQADVTAALALEDDHAADHRAGQVHAPLEPGPGAIPVFRHRLIGGAHPGGHRRAAPRCRVV